MFTTEQINAIAQAVATAITTVSEVATVPDVAPVPYVATEERYIIYVGKKPRRVKAPYIAINADGQLSGFTDEADVLGQGTDKIGKFTKAEIEERFPQFNHEAFLVPVTN